MKTVIHTYTNFALCYMISTLKHKFGGGSALTTPLWKNRQYWYIFGVHNHHYLKTYSVQPVEAIFGVLKRNFIRFSDMSLLEHISWQNVSRRRMLLGASVLEFFWVYCIVLKDQKIYENSKNSYRKLSLYLSAIY